MDTDEPNAAGAATTGIWSAASSRRFGRRLVAVELVWVYPFSAQLNAALLCRRVGQEQQRWLVTALQTLSSVRELYGFPKGRWREFHEFTRV